MPGARGTCEKGQTVRLRGRAAAKGARQQRRRQTGSKEKGVWSKRQAARGRGRKEETTGPGTRGRVEKTQEGGRQ